MSPKIKIGLAEDHALVRQGFIKMLGDYERIEVMFEAGNGKELIKGIKEFKPDMILLDIEMPVLGGITAMQKIRQQFPKIKIIVISAHAEEQSIIEYVKLGADCFLPKNCKIDELVKAIHTVQERGRYFDEKTVKLLAKSGTFPPAQKPGEKENRQLTEREISFLRYFCQQRSYEEIAQLMHINLKTVDWYKHKVILKTKVENAEALLAYAIKNGLVEK